LQSIPQSDVYRVKVFQCSSPWRHMFTIRCYSKPSKSSAYIRTYSYTKSMELEKLILFRPIKFSVVLCSLRVHYPVHKCSTLVSIRSQINTVHALPSHYFHIHFNIILPSTSSSFKVLFLSGSPQNPHIHFSPAPYDHMPWPSHFQ